MTAIVVSKIGPHCIGDQRQNYLPFLQRIATSGRRVAGVKVRDNFGAIDQVLELWPETPCIGVKTDWDGGPFDAKIAANTIIAAHQQKPQITRWEWFNEIDGRYSEQADVYIELMPLLKAAGLDLVMFSCASGTPQYPNAARRLVSRFLGRFNSALETPYDAITRACKFARDNGYDAWLGLHEYWTGTPDTIGRYKVLADYLQARNALIPIVISEWLFEVHPGDTQFMAAVRDNDPVYMGDDRVKFITPWTLGGAGWQQSNYENALPALGEYIATVGGQQTMPFIFGVHATASPGPLLAGDAAGISAAGKFNGYKFLTGDPPAHYQQIAALGLQPANALTRLFVDFSNRPKPTAAQFCDEQRLAIQEAMSAGVTWFEIHNEPNLPGEWPYSQDPHDFITWLLQVVAQLRANHPGIKLVSPGLSPQPNTPQWWTDFAEHGVFAACDAIGAHVYWPDRQTMLTPAQGLNFIPLQQYASTSKPIYITEYANNQTNSTDLDKGAQYVEWAAYIQAHHPLVTRAYCYIISSGTASDNATRQTIVRSGVVSQIANGIFNTDAPPPQNEDVLDHWEDLDTGENLGNANPLKFVITSNRRIHAVTRPKQTTVTCTTSADSGSVTGGGPYSIGSDVTLEWLP